MKILKKITLLITVVLYSTCCMATDTIEVSDDNENNSRTPRELCRFVVGGDDNEDDDDHARALCRFIVSGDDHEDDDDF